MADLVFTNFAGSRLAFGVTDTDLTAVVESGGDFPDAPAEGEFVAVIEDVDGSKEIVRCPARSGDTLTIERAQEGTVARSFAAGSWLEIRYTAGAMDEYFQRIGLDSGLWSTASSGDSRKSLQVRRNFTEPGNVPVDLYEGELAVDMASATPRLFLGPLGAANNGTGVPVLPVVISDTEPANPYDGLVWYDSATEMQVWIYSGASGQFEEVSAKEVTGTYATTAYVDAQVDVLRGELNAPSGTRTVFAQATAPPGWQQDFSINDRVLRVVAGAGGGLGGDWTLTGVSIAGHGITIAEMPVHDHGGGSHIHQYSKATINASLNVQAGASYTSQNVSSTTDFTSTPTSTVIDAQGNGNAHNHGINNNGGWRPAYTNIIIATKA